MTGPDDYKILAEIEEARDAADWAFDVDPGLFASAIGDEYSAGWVEQNGLNAAVADRLCDTVCACCGRALECDDMADCLTVQTIHAALGSGYYHDDRQLPCPRSPGDEDIAELGLNECRACAACWRYIGEDGLPTAEARAFFGDLLRPSPLVPGPAGEDDPIVDPTDVEVIL